MSYKSNIPKAVQQIKTNQQRALHAIGIFGVGEVQVRTPVDTGRLKGSYTYNVQSHSVLIGTNVKYAIFVEKGTRRMRAKPHLSPALEDNRERIKKLVGDYMRKGLV